MKKRSKQKGPEPDRLVIDDQWQRAMGKALKKKKPKDGWPDQEISQQKDSK